MNMNMNKILSHFHIVVLRLPFVAELEFLEMLAFKEKNLLEQRRSNNEVNPHMTLLPRRLSRLDCRVCICRSVSYRSNTNNCNKMLVF